MARIRVLWIEDGAFDETRTLTVPVYMTGRYTLTIEINASDGMRALSYDGPFDAVVVDIRLPPGDDDEWVEAFDRAAHNKLAARLGLQLLQAALSEESRMRSKPDRGWIVPERFGVLTVETRPEIGLELERLGIRVYRRKQGIASRRLLLEVIEEIIANLGKPPEAGRDG